MYVLVSWYEYDVNNRKNKMRQAFCNANADMKFNREFFQMVKSILRDTTVVYDFHSGVWKLVVEC